MFGADDPPIEVRAEPARGGGFGEQFAELLPQLLMAFSAGQAIRQRDPQSLSQVIGTFAQGIENRRRTKFAEEAQRFREEREARLARQSGMREERLVKLEEARGTRETAAATERGEDNYRQLIRDGQAAIADMTENPAALEEVLQQYDAIGQRYGRKPGETKGILMGFASGLKRAPTTQDVYTIGVDGTPQKTATVPTGSLIRNAPRAPQPREAPAPALRVGINPATNKREFVQIFRDGTQKWTGIAAPESSARGLEADLRALGLLPGAPGSGAPAPPPPTGGRGGRGSGPGRPTVPAPGAIKVTAPNGKVYTFKTQAEADSFKRAAGIR
jgi:hypothetical protein